MEKETNNVKLFFCESCGLTQLVDSCPPEVIYDDYVTLSGWKFQPQVKHEIDLTRKLTGLGPDANIIEIGCNDALFLETSALTGENVEEVFLKCARSILSRIESGLINPKSMIGGGVRPYGNDDGNVSNELQRMNEYTFIC